MTSDSLLKQLEDSVAQRDRDGLDRLLSGGGLLPAGPAQVLSALSRGLERVRLGMAEKSLALPDLLLAIDCFNAGAKAAEGMDPKSAAAKGPVVVIGVVEGDVHHMGKNIVAAVLAANGYTVHDAGRDVPGSVFLDLVKKSRADVLALSAMMSTPQRNMADLITALRLTSPGTSVIVGGASMDLALAHRLGADGYAENALTAPEEFSRVLAGRARLRA